MSDKKQIFQFLHDLHNNNHKQWMDDNRERYHHAKDIWLAQISEILMMLGKHDPELFHKYQPKDCISRITNNRMYNPDLPMYKNFFTFSPMDKADALSSIYISVGSENSFLGSGYHNPDKQTLKKIRDAIDYNGAELTAILEEPAFKKFFGGLSDFTEKLKTAPQGYPKDHKFIELLRYKNFVISRNLTEDDVVGSQFVEIVEQAYLISKPFRQFLREAGSF